MTSIVNTPAFQELLQQWRSLVTPEDPGDWPEDHFQALAQAGGWRWNLSPEVGGDGLSSPDMLAVYRELASASLVATFILTQRNAACQRIELGPDSEQKTRLLNELASGQLFATVGISHLTTSQQHAHTPPVAVERSQARGGFILNGRIPWATSATRADVIVTGGTLPDQTQILAVIPTARSGVVVQPPVAMLALNASQTGAVVLQNVLVHPHEILQGPVEKVMSQGQGGGAGSLGTSALAIGAAQGTLRQFADEVERRPDLAEFFKPLQQEADDLSRSLDVAASGSPPLPGCDSETIRRRANSLVTRAAQVWLAATKGAGFVSGHPAQLAVRESLFFLVWSCPQPVLAANLRELSCAE